MKKVTEKIFDNPSTTGYNTDMNHYDTDDYELLRRAALALVELRLRTGRSPEELIEDLTPMLDEDLDEF